MIVYVVVALLVILVLAKVFVFGKNPTSEKEKIDENIVEEQSTQNEEDDGDQKEPQPDEQAAAAGPSGAKSFKKLKQMSKKKGKTKTGSGPDPSHQAYLAGLKGITSSLVDFETISTEHWLFALVAEENSQITAFAIDQESPDAKPRVISRNCKIDGGVKITSATFSCLKSADQRGQASQNLSVSEEKALPIKFVVAVSCFDHCMVKVL